MDYRKQQRQEKHREHLRIYAFADVLFGHADLLHYLKSRLVLVALGDLLVVNDEDGGYDKHDAEHDAEEEQAAERAVKIVSCRGHAAEPEAAGGRLGGNFGSGAE